MSVEAKNDRWVEVRQAGELTAFRVTLSEAHLEDEATALVDVLSFGVAPDMDSRLGRPTSWIAVEDLKELVRLAEEEPEVLGRPEPSGTAADRLSRGLFRSTGLSGEHGDDRGDGEGVGE